MATVSSERVLRMKENFMSLHEEGKSVPEIAEMFHLAKGTVYRYLDEIAAENGTTREDLLQQIPKTPTFWKREQKQVHVDVDELNRNFDLADQALTAILNQIDNILEEEKENEQKI